MKKDPILNIISLTILFCYLIIVNNSPYGVVNASTDINGIISSNSIWTKTQRVDVSNNWWATTNTTIIDQNIYDVYNNFSLGEVNFFPILTEVNPQTIPAPNAKPPEALLNILNQNQSFLLLIDLIVIVIIITVSVIGLFHYNKSKHAEKR